MRIAVVVALTACGRIGYEPRILDDATSASDAQPDTQPASCPTDTIEVPGGVTTLCIDRTERGSEIWTTAKATCEAAGRRLCADAEWALACTTAQGLVDMTDDNWEWVAEETGGVAQKRGFEACDATSEHEIFVDPYDYRCCMNL